MIPKALFLFVLLGASLFSAAFAETSSLPRRILLAANEESECPMMYAPYVCSIRDMNGKHSCGGIVIAEDAVLTSAGCVDRRIKAGAAEKPIIFIGGYEIDEPVQIRVAEKIFVHDKWQGNVLLGYDIAIIKLDKPTCVQPTKFIGKRGPKQEHFTVFGFGRTGSSGEFSTKLQGGHLQFISRSECNKKFNLPEKTGWDTVCFKTAGGIASICAGDEGGPIMHAPFTPVYEDSLIAIASYTVGRCDDTNSIAVATNVRKFKKWIQKIMRSDAFNGTSTVGIEAASKNAGSKKKKKTNRQ